MNALELKIPPAVVVLVAGVAMWLASVLVPALAFEFPWRRALGAILAGAGVLLGGAGVAAFRCAGTTVHPQHPEKASAMVTSGVYRYSRNPMYLGLLLLLAAWAVHLANLLAFVFLPLFVAWMNRFQIVPEERALAARFGASFDAYRRSVRRWI